MFYYYRGPLPAEALWLGLAASPQRPESRLAARRFLEARRFRLEGVRVWHLDRGRRGQPRGRGALKLEAYERLCGQKRSP